MQFKNNGQLEYASLKKMQLDADVSQSTNIIILRPIFTM